MNWAPCPGVGQLGAMGGHWDDGVEPFKQMGDAGFLEGVGVKPALSLPASPAPCAALPPGAGWPLSSVWDGGECRAR